jgi:hypothetical protein
MLLEIHEMSAFSPANIPSGVNTLEELFVWSGFALAELNPNINVQAASGTVEPAVSAQIVKLPNQATDPERVVLVGYIPLAPDWKSVGKIFTGGIKEFSQTVLPVGYTSN